MTGILVLGGAGRMGRAILAEAAADQTIDVRGALVTTPPSVELPGSPPVFTDMAAALAAGPHSVVLEFTNKSAVGTHVLAAARAGNPVVVGATGLDESEVQAIHDAAAQVAVIEAPNTSAGISFLTQAIRTLGNASALGWDAAVVDRHHRGKLDAPSGTARLLQRVLRESGWDPAVLSVRQGGVVGEHTITLSGDEEELVLVHRAFSRRVFARGALLAAQFAANAKPGHYSMNDVVENIRGD